MALRLSRLTANLRKIADLETRSLEFTPIQIPDLFNDVLTAADDLPEKAFYMVGAIEEAVEKAQKEKAAA